MSMNDTIKWHPRIEVVKYDASSIAALTRDLGHEPSGPELRALEAAGRIAPDDILRAEGNLLTTAGLTRICSLITGAGGNAFNSSNAYCGVGDHNGNATNDAAVGDTALSASTNKYYLGTPDSLSASGATITAVFTYGGAVANFAWNEWCWGIANGAITPGTTIPTGVMLNHKIQALGTKGSGASWTLNATVTLS